MGSELKKKNATTGRLMGQDGEMETGIPERDQLRTGKALGTISEERKVLNNA